MRRPFIFNLSDITIDRGKSCVQIVKTGTFIHETYGEFSITPLDLVAIVENFNNNARRLSEEDGRPILPFDYRHKEDDIAAGWITNLELTEDGNQLFANVEWTPAGEQKIHDKEFKFTSPSICRNYKDAETGQIYNIVLRGAALTNIPFLKDMAAVNLLSESQKDKIKHLLAEPQTLENQKVTMPIEEILKAIAVLSPEEKAELISKLRAETPPEKPTVAAAEPALAELSEKHANVLIENKDLKKQVLAETMRRENAEKEKSFAILLTEGKAVPAQKEAYIKGDMEAFVKSAVDIKLNENGQGGDVDIEKINTQDKANDKLLELAEALAEKSKLPFHIAMKDIIAKNQDLYNLSETKEV